MSETIPLSKLALTEKHEMTVVMENRVRMHMFAFRDGKNHRTFLCFMLIENNSLPSSVL